MATCSKDKPIHSIQRKTILTFSIFSLCLIVFIWLFQAIYFSAIYEKVKANEVEYICKDVVRINSTFDDPSNALHELAMQKNVEIIIFSTTDNGYLIKFNNTRELQTKNIGGQIKTVLDKLGDQQYVSYETTSTDLNILNCILRDTRGSTTTYYYISAPISPVKNTTENFSYMLVFISIGVLCATMVGAYFLSSSISKPIIRMAKSAQQITKTNNDVEFMANEYLEVHQLADTLNYAIGELKKTDNVRKEVIANVSHELKTPLTMIKSYTELINDISGDNPEKRKQHLNIIHTEAEKLEYLINDMMDYSKLESGVMTYEKSKFDLYELIKQIKTTYASKYPDFKFTLSGVKKAIIYADKKRIDQVLTNLINNAINYSSTKKEINIRLKQTDVDDEIRLEIIDHGIGISKENIEYIFDRHFRSSSAKRATVGSGIGLSIVKSILNHHSYTFGATSKENKGSTFYVNFKTIQDVGE